jgi:hypothetical protein
MTLKVSAIRSQNSVFASCEASNHQCSERSADQQRFCIKSVRLDALALGYSRRFLLVS